MMSKKVKEQVSDSKKVKDDMQVVEGEIHLLIYQVSETEERVLSSYNHKEDILFLINEFSKSQTLREKHNIKNIENLKMITTSLECDFGIELPSIEIRKKEMAKLFDDLESSISKMEESKVEKIN
tara:strand:+ start:339 stop:713 length:375 start_codon:yes stop_codon:yes gene_type:complete